MSTKHTFHIPVMGIGFTIDTPLKVSKYGIDSVISLVDDILLEKLRKMYCEKFTKPYQEITNKIEDFRAKRITSYLNLINTLAEEKFEELKNASFDKIDDIKTYFNMLPDGISIKQEFQKLTASHMSIEDVKSWVKDKLTIGSIDVNIMTKVDKENYLNGEKLPSIYNDAHAALRGFAESNLESSVIFSAGMNPRLYAYIEEFNDFYPDEKGAIKKKIILKVSDFRSALIQGKFLAKKGIWISEYRIESGLNCGGHAFATDGFLMGPILSEFKEKRQELHQEVYTILENALNNKNRVVPNKGLSIKVSAQGGVGTSEEHQFLIDQYNVDSVGWGSPLLLVPEATNVDKHTLGKLLKAKEDDLYLSNISPLGVPFNSLRGNSKDAERIAKIDKGRPGSTCPRQFVKLSKEFSDKAICLASRQYQNLKIKVLEAANLAPDAYKKKFNAIVEKTCTCVGLGTSALLVNNLNTKTEGPGVSVCPGPNMAYFSKIMNLQEMIDHIYGRKNVISRTDRPNMFVNEINIYIDYLKDKIDDAKENMTTRQEKYLLTFTNNLNDGINYYKDLFSDLKYKIESTKSDILNDLEDCKAALNRLHLEIENQAKLIPVTV
ncbi:MAG: hypothetical protein L3J45_10350 [Flavobacteriaceae bacterium]|nr:hypothetical protein [Flavobacteriaceae bacterium]